MIAEHLVERLLGIDGPRVNRKAGAFGGESVLRLRKSKLVADQIHQVGGILPVMDRKAGVEPNLAGVLAEKPCSNAMERPAQVRASVIMPAFAPITCLHIRSTRVAISAAARRENVISRMRCGSAPLTMRWATRWASVLVLPDPAPAMTSSGAAATHLLSWTPSSTARRCSGLSFSRYAVDIRCRSRSLGVGRRHMPPHWSRAATNFRCRRCLGS